MARQAAGARLYRAVAGWAAAQSHGPRHLLAVGLRRYQAAAIARTCCYLVSGHSYLTGFPMSTIYGKRSVPVLSVRHPQIFYSVEQWSTSGQCAGIRIRRPASWRCPI